MSGLTATETERMVELVRAVNASGVTILLIEHVMRAVMSLSQRIVVLNYGERIAAGRPEAVARDPRVIEAYLGEGESGDALLRLDGLEVAYGDMTAVRGVSLEVASGEIVALIGSNGAGKTTTLRAMGVSSARGAAASSWTARPSRARTGRDRRPRGRSRARGPPALPHAHGGREPGAGRAHPREPPPARRDPGAGLRPLPAPGRAAATRRRARSRAASSRCARSAGPSWRARAS